MKLYFFYILSRSRVLFAILPHRSTKFSFRKNWLGSQKSPWIKHQKRKESFITFCLMRFPLPVSQRWSFNVITPSLSFPYSQSQFSKAARMRDGVSLAFIICLFLIAWPCTPTHPEFLKCFLRNRMWSKFFFSFCIENTYAHPVGSSFLVFSLISFLFLLLTCFCFAIFKLLDVSRKRNAFPLFCFWN